MIDGKFIFIHVPKNGGTAVCRALGEKSKSETHKPMFAVEKRNRFAFGFMRNPWDRMVSVYHFLCQKPIKQNDNFNQAEVKAMGFKRWLIESEFFLGEELKSKRTPPAIQRRPQIWWLEGCDYIGKFERLESEVEYIASHLGIKSAPLRKVNESIHAHYRDYYDDSTRKFIAEHFSDDIERFRYVF